MNQLLPLGSVVRLAKGDAKLMIISRFPLFENKGEVGYFDYGACVYPTGHNDAQLYFFNQEDIAKVYFEGYIDESEEEAQKIFEEQSSSIAYPRFKVEDMDSQV